MRLVKISLTGQALDEAPYWLYGIPGIKGTLELTWFTEDELISLKEIQSPAKF